jgi:Sporulation and spore germination.
MEIERLAHQRNFGGGSKAMIPRHQTILFVILLVASIVMGGVLWHLRNRAHERMLAGEDSAPTQAPQVAPTEQATLMVANDQDNSLTTQVLSLPLPQSPNARAQVILGKLLEIYALPNSAHPVSGGAAGITQVFLLPATGGNASSSANSQSANAMPSGKQLAVVNLSGAFAANHPSGLETETLTVLSICATLHANLPNIAQVRFLVDGQPRADLAGHADLKRTYLTADPVTQEGIQP